MVLPLRQVNGSISPITNDGDAVCNNADRYLHVPLQAGDLLVLWYICPTLINATLLITSRAQVACPTIASRPGTGRGHPRTRQCD